MGNIPFNVNQCQNLISQILTGTQSTVASLNNSITPLQIPNIQQNTKNILIQFLTLEKIY